LVTFVAAAVCAAIVSAAWAGVASARSAAPGSLEICKSKDNGAAGVLFSFTATHGTVSQTVSVKGGDCAAAFGAAAGNWTIVEDLSSGLWKMVGADVTGGALLSENDALGKVKVTVSAGNETQVSITNDQAGSTVKVCKFSSASAFQGKQYSYTVGGVGVQATAGATKATAGCSGAVSFLPGSRITITESVPANQTVKPVSATSQTTIRNQNGGVVKITVGAGANIVWFDNEPVGPPQNGLLEVCKDAGDGFVPSNKAVAFTITDSTGASDTENVLPGQCSGAVTVAAGNVNVAEAIPDGEYVSDIFLGQNSAGQLGPVNLNNGTAVVVVPVASAGDTQVHFKNSTFLTTLKVCKYLTASSGGLDGTRFNFTVKDDAGTQTVRIVANTGVNGTCKNVTDAPNSNGGNLIKVPVGSSVIVTEASLPYVGVDGGAPGAGGSQTITAATGINTISFHNQAYGQFELCKNMQTLPTDDTGYNGTVFSFVVNGDTAHPIALAAGRCGQPVVLPAGTVKVEETPLPTGFQFVSSTATGPLNDNRCVPPVANCGNPITFTVPYFNDPAGGGETLVKFVNQVQRVQLKICKQIDPGSTTAIGSLSFTFDYAWSGGGSGKATLSPPYIACTGLIGGPGGIPIVQPDGTATKIVVQEEINGDYHVSDITLDSGTVISNTPPAIVFNPAVGFATVTFTNAAGGGGQSCLSASSLSVLVQGTNVVSYVPHGSWFIPANGIGAVNVEGTSITNTLIPTVNSVNSCASNWTTGRTVCTANNTDVYLLSGTTLGSTLTSGGSGLLSFSGGTCTNCSVAIDAVHNKAVIGLSVGGAGGFQFLNLATNAFEPAFVSQAPGTAIAEDPVIDSLRNLILSPAENGNFELIDVTSSTSPAFFESPTGLIEPDSVAEDCSTGITVVPDEFVNPTSVLVTDLSQATLTPGTPGTWSAPSQVQSLTESNFVGGGGAAVGGSAIAQGTHTGLVAPEFGGSDVTAIALPSTSGFGTPAVQDWVTCTIPGFSTGLDPHTVTAYQSPNGGDAIGLLANQGGTLLARVDLTQMLNPLVVPRTVGGHGCLSGTLPGSVFTLIPVP
jgi:hypothetical protein